MKFSGLVPNKFSLRQKLYLMLISTTLLFLIGGYISYESLRGSAVAWQLLDEEYDAKQMLLNEVQSYMGYGHGIHNFKNMIIRRDLSSFDNAYNDFGKALESIDRYTSLKSVTDDEIKALGQVKVLLSQYQSNTLIAKRLIEQGLSAQQVDARLNIDPSSEVDALKSLQNSINQARLHKKNIFSKMLDKAPRILLIAWLISLAVSVVIVQLVGNSILASVKKLAHAANEIAQGDLSHKIHTNEGDTHEMSMLTHSLEQMRVSLTQNIIDLEMSNKDLEQYAYVVSHDLQEPLRKILAFGSKIESSTAGKLDEESMFYLSRMLDSASRMRTLIDDLLSYARITKKNPTPEPVDLNRVLENVWSDLEIAAKEKGAKLKYKILPTVSADPVLMQQLFQNLVHNALKFSRPDAPPVVEILSELSETPGYADFFVKDNGIGFAQKYAERIMAPFQRLHARNEYAGTGIGLAVCSKIVLKHGGKLKAQSVLGEGSEFIFRLPVAPDKAG